MTVPSLLVFAVLMVPVLVLYVLGMRWLWRCLEPRYWARIIRRELIAEVGTVPGAFETEGGKRYLEALERMGMSAAVRAAVERVKAADDRAAAVAVDEKLGEQR
jgi:hypothetical protein